MWSSRVLRGAFFVSSRGSFRSYKGQVRKHNNPSVSVSKKIKIRTSVMVLFHVFCKHANYLFVPQFTSPFTFFTWTFDGK